MQAINPERKSPHFFIQAKSGMKDPAVASACANNKKFFWFGSKGLCFINIIHNFALI
jgi:hypothetical protein